MRTGLFLALVVASAISSTAEAVPLEGTVQLVDPAARRLSITRNTADGDKTLSLDVSPKAGNLSSLKMGDRVTLDYEPEQEVVTKIGGGDNGPGAPGQSKAEVAINMIAPDSLKGWHLDTPVQEANWVVANGVLICTSKGPHLVSDAAFDDFEMTLEFLLPPKCNSGIYLRNRYEIQFLDSMWRTPDNKPAKPHQITGAIWGYITPTRDAYLGPNQWNRLDARLVGDEITVRLNNKKIIDNQPLNRKLGANEDEAVAALGPFLLQYHTNTEGMKIRNFVVRPIATKD